MIQQIHFITQIKRLSMLTLFVLVSEFSRAQSSAGQFEVSGSVGALSGRYIYDQLSASDEESIIIDQSESLNYLVSGKYFVSDRIALGLTTGIQTIYGGTNQDNQEPHRIYTFRKVDATYAAELTFVRFTVQWFQFYALVGVGIDPYTEYISYQSGGSDKNTGLSFTKQLTPFGVRVGGKVAAYFELGLGYKGLINGGLSYSFGKAKDIQHKRHVKHNNSWWLF